MSVYLLSVVMYIIRWTLSELDSSKQLKKYHIVMGGDDKAKKLW
jgi:hypothetical protein